VTGARRQHVPWQGETHEFTPADPAGVCERCGGPAAQVLTFTETAGARRVLRFVLCARCAWGARQVMAQLRDRRRRGLA